MNTVSRDNGERRFMDFAHEEMALTLALRQVFMPSTDSEKAAETVLERLVETPAGRRHHRRSDAILARKWAWAASAVAASLLVAALILLSLGGRPALAETIRQLKEAETLLIEITGYEWQEGKSEPVEVKHGTIWQKGDSVFMDFPDRKAWVLNGIKTTYFPKTKKVWIREARAEDSARGISTDALIGQLEGLGLTKLPESTEVIAGKTYIRFTMVPDAERRDVDMVLYIDPDSGRLDYAGYQIASGPHKGRFHSWMEYTYNPGIDEELFEPTYPADATVQQEGQRENTEDIVKVWRNKALVVARESEGLEVGLLGVWLAPDGLLGLHLYEYKVWTSGTAFPDQVFPAEELIKGGFTPKDWRNTNVVLECPDGMARRLNRNVPLATSYFTFPGKGPFLREVRRFVSVPELLSEERPEVCTLHVWVLRQPPTPFHWRKGYKENKENFAHLTLEIPVPEETSKSPSESFIFGMADGARTPTTQTVRFRAWLAERNEGVTQALKVIEEQPLEIQHELARTKLKLLKTLGKQEEIDQFLRIHIPWCREHDRLHERNVPRLIKEFASPGFEAAE